MRRLFNNLLKLIGARSADYCREAVEAATARASGEGFKAGHAAGQAVGYQIGLAQGELKGRDALALELQIKHGMDGGGEKQMTNDDIATLRVRQVH